MSQSSQTTRTFSTFATALAFGASFTLSSVIAVVPVAWGRARRLDVRWERAEVRANVLALFIAQRLFRFRLIVISVIVIVAALASHHELATSHHALASSLASLTTIVIIIGAWGTCDFNELADFVVSAAVRSRSWREWIGWSFITVRLGVWIGRSFITVRLGVW
jgi:hypothetical protein